MLWYVSHFIALQIVRILVIFLTCDSAIWIISTSTPRYLCSESKLRSSLNTNSLTVFNSSVWNSPLADLIKETPLQELAAWILSVQTYLPILGWECHKQSSTFVENISLGHQTDENHYHQTSLEACDILEVFAHQFLSLALCHSTIIKFIKGFQGQIQDFQ